MTEGEYPRVSDARLVELGDIARTNEKRGYALSIHERAYLDLADARALLRDAAEHLMWADAAIQRAEEVPDTPERVVDLLEGARAEIIALRARIEGGGVVVSLSRRTDMVRVSDEELEDPNRFDEVIAYGDLFHDLRDARALLRDAAEALQECRVAARVGDYQHRIERIDATTKPIIARIEGGAS